MTKRPNITLRKAKPGDREKAVWVESKSTPHLSYVGDVFDVFVSDEVGDFGVAEVEGEVVGCGKYTIVPDGSAWLETLRVIPERQGMGIGKRFYERWLDLTRHQGVKTMRMYTGVNNVVSKGLAERYGLRLTETFRGAYKPCQAYYLLCNVEHVICVLFSVRCGRIDRSITAPLSVYIFICIVYI